jgi:hypothetical protein
MFWTAFPVEIKATRQRTGIPFLYITQNLDEAVETGGRVIEVIL